MQHYEIQDLLRVNDGRDRYKKIIIQILKENKKVINIIFETNQMCPIW